MTLKLKRLFKVLNCVELSSVWSPHQIITLIAAKPFNTHAILLVHERHLQIKSRSMCALLKASRKDAFLSGLLPLWLSEI